MHNDSLCEFFDGIYQVTMAYGTLEFLAVVFNIMLFERYLSFVIGRDYGSPKFMRVLSGLVLVFHAGGLATYFIMLEPGFEQECTYARLPNQLPIKCVKEGPIIALTAGVIQTFMFLQVNYSFCYRDKSGDKGLWTEASSVYGFSLKAWMKAIFALHFLFYILAVVGLTAMEWVERSSPTEVLSGGLLRCVDCPLSDGSTVGTR